MDTVVWELSTTPSRLCVKQGVDEQEGKMEISKGERPSKNASSHHYSTVADVRCGWEDGFHKKSLTSVERDLKSQHVLSLVYLGIL